MTNRIDLRKYLVFLPTGRNIFLRGLQIPAGDIDGTIWYNVGVQTPFIGAGIFQGGYLRVMNETMYTILSRRSIRRYQQEQLKNEALEKILEAGKFAPSGVNQQSWHFTIVQNTEMLERINEGCKKLLQRSDSNFSVFYNAPTLIIVSGDSKAITPQYDCTLALGTMFLAAASLGIGS